VEVTAMPTSAHRRACSILLLASLFGFLALPWCAAEPPLVCTGGMGSFTAQLVGGITVSIGAEHSGGFARRGCQARFSWDGQQLPIATSAADIDADALGIDLGVGVPVAAFQIRSSARDPLMRYEIYTLKKPPRLLRTLTGSDTYSAADADLDGRIEIWAADAGVFNGLDGLRLSAFDFAPPVVLRFEHQQLLDVSAEFQAEYDQRIAGLRTQLTPGGMEAFRTSDGRLDVIPPEKLHIYREMLQTKIKVLEIVACYLWSGRDAEAAKALDELWPAGDRERIHAALINARAHGIHTQVDAVSAGATGTRHHTFVYDPLPTKERAGQGATLWGPAGLMLPLIEASDHAAVVRVDTAAIPIQLSRPEPTDARAVPAMAPDTMMKLLLDAAGKVREAYMKGAPDPGLIAATSSWKFIPAYKENKPVAAWMELSVSLQQ
jgi:hypothetical protein